MHHRVAPDALVDLLALEHVALGLGEDADGWSSRRVRSAATRASTWYVSGRISRPPAIAVLQPRRLRPPAAPDDGFDARDQLVRVAGLADPVVGSEPQRAHALGHGRLVGVDEHRHRGGRAQTVSRYGHACGPSTSRSITSASSRMATSASGGTGDAKTRCCQPARWSRFARTVGSPLSASTIPSRIADRAVVIAPASIRLRRRFGQPSSEFAH